MEWGMAHLCHYEPIQVVLVLAIDEMEMDLYDAYPRHNHDKHHYFTRQGVGHAPFGASRAIASSGCSNDQTAHVKFFPSHQCEQ
jgi:hypothetical protein